MLLDLHLALVIATICGVLYADEQGLAWFLGRRRTLDARIVGWLHDGVAAGLGLLIATGGLLYMNAPRAYLTDATFLVKMGAVAALIANTYFIARLSPIAFAKPYAETTRGERLKLLASGGVSAAGWGAAVLCGYLLS
jgi:hypothetical protein